MANKWANMVKNGNTWLVNNSYNHKVTFRGASDIELGFCGPSLARAWVNGYDSLSGRPFYVHFGDAAGCQTFSTGGPDSQYRGP